MLARSVIAALALSAASCAPATVDLVQPGAVSKTTFEGEWYWMNTVSEVPYGTATTFTGAQTELERLRWKVEEDLLVGYRSYEHVDASNAPSGVGVEDGGFFGSPLVAYRIEKHFDIRRQYDRRTGEESNVVIEDMERPWFEREYMRVDFSTNVADVSWTFAGVNLPVLDFVNDDPDDATAPQLDDTDADGVIDSMLLTTKVLAQPDSLRLPGYGDIPVCLFYGQAEYDCAATVVEIRSSFLRVDAATPYQGLRYDDHWMETYGYFATERIAYDRGHGVVEPNRVFWANRHDLWQETFVTDDDGRVMCTAKGDVTRACHRLTAADDPKPMVLDPRERAVKPVVYHAGPDFPEAYRSAMEEVADAWDAPLRDTVGGLRFWACVEDGGDAEDCEGHRDVEERLFVFCANNPSLADDPDVCSTDHTGPNGVPDGVPDLALPGDLRYSFVHLIDQPQLSSPYGYGPSAADPTGVRIELADGTTLDLGAGEILSGNANLYTSVLDRVSHRTADLAQLLNGEVRPDDFIEGEDLQAFVDAANAHDPQALVGCTHGAPKTWTTEAVAERAGRISNGFSPLLKAQGSTAAVHVDPVATLDSVRAATERIERDAVLGTSADGLARFEAMATSPFADRLWSSEVVGSMGYDPSTQAGPAQSPLDLVHPMRQAELESGRVLAGKHAVDLDDEQFAEPSLVARAQRWARSRKSYDEIVFEVQQEAFREVMLHEVGHTMGLRHNFAGSFDAFNYPEAYWELRDDGSMGPRHVDPETDDELTGGIRELQYASIMDYGGGMTTGWHGLGRYDEAAIKFGYGLLVEVMDEVPEAETFPGIPNDVLIGYLSLFNGSNVYPSPLLTASDGGILEVHYTDYPQVAGDLDARVDVPLSHLGPVLSPTGTGFDDMMVVTDGAGIVPDGAPAAPYRFCSDEFAIGMTCARFDEGADAYEAQRFLMDQYWNHYLVNNFARQRYGFGSAAGYISRLQGRIFGPLGTWQRYYALFHGLFEADTDPASATFFAADRGFGGWTAATDESFRFLTQVVTRPEPGKHLPHVRPDGVQLLVPASGRFGTDIPLGAGAYYESEWDFDSGYHWFERQSRIGSYWDRMLALLALTDTSADGFMGYDTSADPQAYSIGYQDIYRDELALFLGRLMSDDLGSLGPAVTEDGTLVYPDPLDLTAAWPPPNTELVEPAAYWLVQFDAGLFGTSLLARGYDRSFLNRSRIYVEGSGTAIEVPEGQPTVSYADPFSGKTYTAWSFPAVRDGQVISGPGATEVELGSGARMVRHANLLRSYCTGDATAPYTDPEDPEALRAQQELACADLERFASDLDLQLQLYSWFEGQAPE